MTRPLLRRAFVVGIVGVSAVSLTSCSSDSSLSGADATAKCEEAVQDKYVEAQRPAVFDSVTATEDGDWTVSGMSRGTHPAKAEKGKPAPKEGERSSKDMAHMKFVCTVSDKGTKVDEWRLANQQDIADSIKLSETSVPAST